MTEDELFAKYPKIFPLMTTPYYRVSSEIPQGWIDLVDQMCADIQNHINYNDKTQIICEQIKEKYAELRFYITSGDDFIDGMIHVYENLSRQTCMECGSRYGEVRKDGGWLVVLCNDCYKPVDKSQLTLKL